MISPCMHVHMCKHSGGKFLNDKINKSLSVPLAVHNKLVSRAYDEYCM